MFVFTPPSLEVSISLLLVCFLADVMGVDLSGYGFSTIASVLKRFLLELPDTVIPIQWYHRFIDVSGKILSLDVLLFIILISRHTFACIFSDKMMNDSF